jgi:hypothetical protein
MITPAALVRNERNRQPVAARLRQMMMRQWIMTATARRVIRRCLEYPPACPRLREIECSNGHVNRYAETSW